MNGHLTKEQIKKYISIYSKILASQRKALNSITCRCIPAYKNNIQITINECAKNITYYKKIL